jgi:flagellar biosynthesis protein FlhF
LGARLDQAADTAALERLFRDAPSGDAAVIDTAGCNPLDRAGLKQLGDAAQAARAELILVMAAGGDVLESAECALAFAEAGARALITTRLDATRRLGAVLSAADVGRLGLAAAGVSPSIGDGLIEIDPVALARLILPDSARQNAPATLATGTL